MRALKLNLDQAKPVTCLLYIFIYLITNDAVGGRGWVAEGREHIRRVFLPPPSRFSRTRFHYQDAGHFINRNTLNFVKNDIKRKMLRFIVFN